MASSYQLKWIRQYKGQNKHAYYLSQQADGMEKRIAGASVGSGRRRLGRSRRSGRAESAAAPGALQADPMLRRGEARVLGGLEDPLPPLPQLVGRLLHEGGQLQVRGAAVQRRSSSRSEVAARGAAVVEEAGRLRLQIPLRRQSDALLERHLRVISWQRSGWVNTGLAITPILHALAIPSRVLALVISAQVRSTSPGCSGTTSMTACLPTDASTSCSSDTGQHTDADTDAPSHSHSTWMKAFSWYGRPLPKLMTS